MFFLFYLQKSACRLFRASARCEEKRIIQYNKADYRDQNGYTALTRAVVFNQLRSAELLLTDRPQLKLIADNVRLNKDICAWVAMKL